MIHDLVLLVPRNEISFESNKIHTLCPSIPIINYYLIKAKTSCRALGLHMHSFVYAIFFTKYAICRETCPGLFRIDKRIVNYALYYMAGHYAHSDSNS